MKQYESYKDSHIPSIGNVPDGWKVVPIKYVLEQSSNGIKIGPFGSTLTGKVSPDNEVKVYGQWNVIGKDFSAGKNYVSEKTYQELESYWIHPNDILISMMGTVGKCAIIPKGVAKGIMDSHIVKVRLDESVILPQYFYYVYDKDGSNVVMSQIQRDRRGSIMDGLNSTLIKGFIIPLPSIPEQKAIVSYLDTKVSQIDTIIAEKEAMVEDLQSYRKSIITEIVTHGLNPDASMKDSGIDWMGTIPEHWKIVKTSYLFEEIGSGTTPNTNNEKYYVEDGINWLQTGDLNDGYIEKTTKHISLKALEDNSALRVYPKGSLVIAMYGATIGKVGILNIETTTNQACCVLANSKSLLGKYAYYAFIASKQSLVNLAFGGGQPNISQAIIRSHKLPVPPLEEQQAIVSYLDSKMHGFDFTVSELQTQIEDLKSYKVSLITEAVTGKIDLR